MTMPPQPPNLLPPHHLDYKTPDPPASGMRQVFRVLLICFLVFVGLAMLAVGLCFAMIFRG